MKNILCYGDSNTYGTRPIDIDIMENSFIATKYRFPVDKRWTGVLQREFGQDYKVFVEGLNARTTVFDDQVEGEYRNGLRYLQPCLESHAPIDLVILMLGTNDLKAKFSCSAFDIAGGIGVLVNTIQKSGAGHEGQSPEILIICPAHLGKLTKLKDLFGEKGVEESKKLASNYKKIAKLYKCKFIDADKFIKPSDIDGVHFDEAGLENFGKEIAKIVKTIV